MKVTFLGTGTSQGVPIIGCKCKICQSLDFKDKRLRTSVHIETTDGFSIIIDTGPDFRQQMLLNRIGKINAILYTHEHKDHTAGLDDIRAYNYIQREAIPVYGEKRVIEQLKHDYSYVVDNEYPGIPQISFNHIENKPFNLNGLSILPIRVFHHRLPVLGFRINDFTYITDAKTIEPAEVEKLRGSKVLVLNALRKEGHISHLTLNEALQLIEQVKPQTAYFTHISHALGLHKEIEKELPPNVYLAYDGLIIHI